jgi:hypothetical protein
MDPSPKRRHRREAPVHLPVRTGRLYHAAPERTWQTAITGPVPSAVPRVTHPLAAGWKVQLNSP